MDDRGAGAVLRPHLSMMMQALLDSLSDSEASVLNYVSLRAGEGSQAQNAVSGDTSCPEFHTGSNKILIGFLVERPQRHSRAQHLFNEEKKCKCKLC